MPPPAQSGEPSHRVPLRGPKMVGRPVGSGRKSSPCPEPRVGYQMYCCYMPRGNLRPLAIPFRGNQAGYRRRRVRAASLVLWSCCLPAIGGGGALPGLQGMGESVRPGAGNLGARSPI